MLENIFVEHFLAAISSYCLGTIPFGLLLTRLVIREDVRLIGSGNIGATNVLRTGHKNLAILTLLLDMGKGAFATLFVPLVLPYYTYTLTLVSGFHVVIGHNFSFWLKFHGGKGVATTFGALLVISWPVGLLACLTWLVIIMVSRYSSLAALFSLTCAPIYAFFFNDYQEIFTFFLLTLLSWLRHCTNIHRLLTHCEPHI